MGTFLRTALTVVLCFSLGVGLAAGALAWQGRNELLGTRIAVSNLGEPAPETSEAAAEPAGLGEAKTVLVVGDDSNEDISDEYRDIAFGERDGHRTDTIMVMRIDPEAKRIEGINFPRDLFIPLCDGSRQRINAAVFNGGPECLVETLRNFAGIKIDHYVSVNFQGFVEIVNAVNGVTMYLEEPMQDPKAHLDLPAGCVTLDGRSALGFVRTRIDTDFGRIKRQQRFLKELADEATSMDVIANPVRLYQMVDAVGDMLTVDDDLNLGTMRDFALTLRGIDSDRIHMATIPTATDNSTGAWYEIPIEGETQDLLRAFKRGELAQYLGEEPDETPSEAPTPKKTPRPKIPLDELAPIAVLNASDVDQLAARTAAALADAGIQATTADATEPEPPQVRIAYPKGLKAEAKALKVGAFPDAQLDPEPDPDLQQVTVVLNGDHDPDLMEIVDSADAGEQPPSQEETPASQLPQREFKNAAPVEDADGC